MARETLERARGIFDRLGARVWSERARVELARIGGRPRGTTELTETERQAAELAAAGLTNREITDRLRVSLRTVESNLTRVYRKLGVRSRAEMIRKLDSS